MRSALFGKINNVVDKNEENREADGHANEGALLAESLVHSGQNENVQFDNNEYHEQD
jgi:hypothetical protein